MSAFQWFVVLVLMKTYAYATPFPWWDDVLTLVGLGLSAVVMARSYPEKK